MTEREMRRVLSEIAALEYVARHGTERRSVVARQASRTRWERQVDPEGVLAPRERARRARAAMNAHMKRMALQRSLEAEQRKETRARMAARMAAR